MDLPQVQVKDTKVSIKFGRSGTYDFKDAEVLKDWAITLLESALLFSVNRGPMLSVNVEEYAEMIRDEIAANPFLPSQLEDVMEQVSTSESDQNTEDSESEFD